MMQQLKNSKAVTLVIVISVLFILSTTSIAFVKLSIVERRAANNNTVNTRINIALQAGFDYSIALLHQAFLTDDWYGNLENSSGIFPIWHYRGEDINGNGARDLGEADVDNDGTLDCPLSLAPAPSCFIKEYDENIFSSLLGIGYSGEFDLNNESTFSLRIEDLSTHISLKESFSLPPGNFDPQELKGTSRILHNLIANILPFENAVGILQSLEGKNFSNHTEIEQSLSPGVAQVLMRYLTSYGKETNVVIPPVRPDLVEGAELSEPIRYTDILTEPRVPINVNSASVEIITACLNGLRGRTVRPGFINNTSDTSVLEQIALSEDFLNQIAPERQEDFVDASGRMDKIEIIEIDQDLAIVIAQKIIEERQQQEFRSWLQFAEFLGKLVFANTISPEQASLVWANANPNTNYNKSNPDVPDSLLYQIWSPEEDNKLFYRLDKTDLIIYTTEFTFYPTGDFEIGVLARILATASGEVLGNDEISYIVHLFDMIHHTTQKDFLDIELSRQNTVIYPETNNTLSSFIEFDGSLGLSPFEVNIPNNVENQPLNQWEEVVNNGLIGNSSTNSFVDGFYADKQHVLNHNDSRLKNEPPDTVTMLSFWYKPDWDILDVFSRPHSILNANGNNINELFQIYNETQLISNVDERAKLSLFVWDKGSFFNDNVVGGPIKLTLDVPQEAIRSRWMFFAIFWNASKIQIHVNENVKDLRRNANIVRLIFPPPPSINDPTLPDQRIGNSLMFVGENPNLTFDGLISLKLAALNEMSLTDVVFDIDPILTNQASPFHNLFSDSSLNATLKSIAFFLTTTFGLGRNIHASIDTEDMAWKYMMNTTINYSPSNPLTVASGNQNGVFPVLGGLLNGSATGTATTADAASQIPLIAKIIQAIIDSDGGVDPNAFVQFLNKLGYFDPQENTIVEQTIQQITADLNDRLQNDTGNIVITNAIGSFSENVIPLNPDFALFNNKVHLSGNLKYYTPDQQQHIINSPSNGTYADFKLLKLTNLDAAENLAFNLYSKGRYKPQNNNFITKNIPLPVESGANSKIQLGTIRTTIYHSQDSLDFEEDRERKINVRCIIRDSVNNLIFDQVNNENPGIGALLTNNIISYALFFLSSGNTTKEINGETFSIPVVTSPIVDDVTITYTTGHKILEINR